MLVDGCLARPDPTSYHMSHDAIPSRHGLSLRSAFHAMMVRLCCARTGAACCVIQKTVDHCEGRGRVFAHLGCEGPSQIVPSQSDASLLFNLLVKPFPR